MPRFTISLRTYTQIYTSQKQDQRNRIDSNSRRTETIGRQLRIPALGKREGGGGGGGGVDRSLGLDSIEIQRNQFLVRHRLSFFLFHSYCVSKHIFALSIFTAIVNVHFVLARYSDMEEHPSCRVCRLDVGGRADCQTRIHAESMCAFEADKSIRILTTRAVN